MIETSKKKYFAVFDTMKWLKGMVNKHQSNFSLCSSSTVLAFDIRFENSEYEQNERARDRMWNE